MLRITELEKNLKGPVFLKLTYPPEYPNVVPRIEVPNGSSVLTSGDHEGLVENLNLVAEENVGMVMVFTLVEAAKEWINKNVSDCQQDNEVEERQVEEDTSDFLSSGIKFTEAKTKGGKWDYVIGLVGKPSAGKSTFFNAATTLELAKTGAHPFTTIEPNIGKAFYTIPCPCYKLEKRCDAAHGHNFKGDRYMPTLLKDVAGLVPGASDGKGRGNRFLNDLVDADVLIHIIDISGCTNEKGEATVGYHPSLDVQWLNNEIYRWVYDNVMGKWDAIRRKPAKLIDMFTGYRANRAMIHTALQNAGVNEKELAKLPQWNDCILGKVVTEFLRLRFPMLLVLNKADTDTAHENIVSLQEKYPTIPSIPVSAISECDLQQLQKSGVIRYEFGDSNYSILTKPSQQEEFQLNHVSKDVFERYGSTNVHTALCQAVSLKSPVHALPVADLDTLKSIRKDREDPGILRDCIPLKPGTTVDGLFEVMIHFPIQLLAGDFVRAETSDENGKKRQVPKQEEMSETNNVIRIMSTRRR
ncbi:uncharacterized protein LOC135494786 isoform X2 [Lineus longissimus]